MPETQVWLLRHGISTFNAQHRCQGCCDESELTPLGREGACLSGERLSSEWIEAVISSPLRRASDTAEQVAKAIVAQGCKITFETDARLREIELYDWEGLPLEEIPRRFPEQYRDWRLRPAEFRMLANNHVQYPVRSLYDRARLFWNYLLTAYAGQSILLVSHGGTIRALIGTALGLDAVHFHTFQQSNCGLSRLRFPSDSRQARLDLLNDTAHLGDRLPKLKEGRCGVRLLLMPVSDTNHADIAHLAAALEAWSLTICSPWDRPPATRRVSSFHSPSIPAAWFPRPQRILSSTRYFTTIPETNFDTLPSLVLWHFCGVHFIGN